MILKLAEERASAATAFSLGAIILLFVSGLVFAEGPASIPAPGDDTLVVRVLAAELHAAQDAAHPMRFQLRKSTPRLTSTKEIIETKDGAVARLLTINDGVPNATDRRKDDARLDALLADPSRQRRRKQSEQEDTARAVKVLRALPRAFLYRYEGTEGTLQRYSFVPNPKFNPSDLELLVLTAMHGELTIDATQERVTRLDGRLQQDVDIGWGLLGRLNKGGSILIEQADVGGGQWRIVHFQMEMNGRVLFRARSFDTTEDQTHFLPVPVDITYQQAIDLLRKTRTESAPLGR